METNNKRALLGNVDLHARATGSTLRADDFQIVENDKELKLVTPELDAAIRKQPWLAGMTLNAADVSEAWRHQRGYVCMIEGFGGRSIKAGESFSAAFVVGYFDSIDEMEQVYDRYPGHSRLKATADGWKLTK